MLQKISRYYYTLKDLKFQQVFYRVYYALSKKRKVKFNLSPVEAYPMVLQESIISANSFLGNNAFSFLNLTYRFDNKIDWNFTGHGMLWAYNLNYFEFLLQENFPKEVGLKLIHDYIDQRNHLRVALA